VDFLVDLDKDRTLLDLGGLLMDLQNLLGCKVDIVTEKACTGISKKKFSRRQKVYER